jgi:phospholipid transport system substrate-binding protein
MIRAGVFVLLSGLGTSQGLARAPAADVFVRAKIDELADLLASPRADRLDQVRDRVREVAYFSGFSERALGKTWATLSKDEKARFQAAMQELLESHYMARPNSVFDKNKVQVRSAEADEDTAVVVATVKQKDVDIGVVVKLKAKGDAWQVQDVVIDGLSLLEDYRAQFQTFLKKKSLAELVDKLKSKARANLGKKT